MLRLVDSITHAALGAAIGEIFLGKRMGNRALAWGAFFGLLPDIDRLFSIFFGNATNLWWLRGPTHSLVAIGLLAWYVAPQLAKLWKKLKISRKEAGWFVFAALSVHVLADCLPVEGTSVFWPLPVPRVAFNTLYRIDPLFTLPLVVTLVWLAFLRGKKELSKRRKLNAWGLGIAAAYLVLALIIKYSVAAKFDADLARHKAVYQRRMEAPTPYNILLWRSVADCGDELWVGYRSIFEGSSNSVRWTIYPKHKDAVDSLRTLREFRNVDSFSNGWWIARKHVKGAWIGDMRFCEDRFWIKKKNFVDSSLNDAWNILPGERSERLRKIYVPHKETEMYFQRLVSRIGGNHEVWEANPRLAGVTGSLPEFLPATE